MCILREQMCLAHFVLYFSDCLSSFFNIKLHFPSVKIKKNESTDKENYSQNFPVKKRATECSIFLFV